MAAGTKTFTKVDVPNSTTFFFEFRVHTTDPRHVCSKRTVPKTPSIAPLLFLSGVIAVSERCLLHHVLAMVTEPFPSNGCRIHNSGSRQTYPNSRFHITVMGKWANFVVIATLRALVSPALIWSTDVTTEVRTVQEVHLSCNKAELGQRTMGGTQMHSAGKLLYRRQVKPPSIYRPTDSQK